MKMNMNINSKSQAGADNKAKENNELQLCETDDW